MANRKFSAEPWWWRRKKYCIMLHLKMKRVRLREVKCTIAPKDCCPNIPRDERGASVGPLPGEEKELMEKTRRE
jgi:hypothetical protein